MNDNKKISASPNVRKFARELGANIKQISGTEREGRISQKDVKNYINNRLKNKNDKTVIKSQFEHSEFGEIEIKEIPRIKRIAASHLINSWSTIPHVTHHDEADITELEDFRNSLKDIYSGERKKISVNYYDDKIKSSNSFNLISYIKNKNKKTKIFFIIGADNLKKFHKWKNWKKIPELAKIVVFPRQGYSFSSVMAKKLSKKDVIYIKSKKINISSSLIRKFW